MELMTLLGHPVPEGINRQKTAASFPRRKSAFFCICFVISSAREPLPFAGCSVRTPHQAKLEARVKGRQLLIFP